MALINVYKIIRCYVFTLFITIPNFVGAADSYVTLEGRLHTRDKTALVFWHEKYVSIRSAQIVQKSRKHPDILGARRVTMRTHNY